MKTPATLLLAGLTLGIALFCSAQTEEKPVWHKDWPTAQRSAKDTNKPIFAVLVCQH